MVPFSHKESKVGGACSYICSCQAVLAIIMLIWAHFLYDIARVNANSPWDQYLAEMWWWTKFVVCSPLWIHIDPLPLDLLQNKHTHMSIIEYFPHNDSTAARRWSDDSNDWRHDDHVLVMRNVFKNNDNPLQYLNSTDALKEYLEMDRDYRALVLPKNEPWYYTIMPFKDFLDQIEDTSKKLLQLAFSYEVVDEQGQPWLWEKYNQVWTDLGLNLNDDIGTMKIMGEGVFRTHSFLYYGNNGRARLHSAPPPDYFLQVAGKKRWRFVHKRYTPYLGFYRNTPFGSLRSPEYFAEDYPDRKIPYTELIVNPGDLFYFSYWHAHEVWNESPNKLGFAIGIRPSDFLFRFWTDPCRATMTYSYFMLPFQVFHRFVAKGSLKNTWTDDDCTSQAGNPYTTGYNGTKMTRYDIKLINGTCEYQEKVQNYQQLEMSNFVRPDSWLPLNAM